MEEKIRIIVRGFELDDILEELNSGLNDKEIKLKKENSRIGGAIVDPAIIAAGANLLTALIGVLLYILKEKKKKGKIIINGNVFEYPFDKSDKDIVVMAGKSCVKKIILSKD